MLIVTDAVTPLQPGNRIEAEIAWPVQADDKPVRLKLWGSVAWTRERLVAMDAKRYAFEIMEPRFAAGFARSQRRNPFFRKTPKASAG